MQPTTPANDPQPAGGLDWATIIELLDVLEKHGYRRGDDRHVGRAIGLLAQVARIYAGLED